jgi:type IV pilus assembly protein PilE
MKPANRRNGFTLIELLMVVVMVSILIAVAYPAYRNYVLRSNRVEGQTALNFVAQAQEKFFSIYNRYTDVLGGTASTGLQLDTASCSAGGSGANCKYQIAVTITNGGANFTATATPINSQAPDVCGALSLNGLGIKLPARTNTAANANGACW